MARLGHLPLENGNVIEDFQQSYVTHGKLNKQRNNAILICSAISANHHRLDFLIGKGKALDPARWFIVCSDPIGNGLSTSPSNSASQPDMQFPRFSIRDMVAAQYRLLETLGIPGLASVIGASMGGMQALQWAATRPMPITSIVAINAASRTSAWSVAVNEATRSCLMADPSWDGTRFTASPERGWHAWFIVQRVLASRSPESVESEAGSSAELLDLLSLWESNWRRVRPNAYDFLYQSWAYDGHDVDRGMPPDTGSILSKVCARALLLAPALDLYNPVSAIEATARAIPASTFLRIPSIRGHQSAGGADERDIEFLNQAIGDFLESALRTGSR